MFHYMFLPFITFLIQLLCQCAHFFPSLLYRDQKLNQGLSVKQSCTRAHIFKAQPARQNVPCVSKSLFTLISKASTKQTRIVFSLVSIVYTNLVRVLPTTKEEERGAYYSLLITQGTGVISSIFNESRGSGEAIIHGR